MSFMSILLHCEYPHHRFIIEEVDNANSIHAFNRFEEKGYVERSQCHFRLVDILHDVFYALAAPATQELIFFFSEYFVSDDWIQKLLV